MGKQVQEEGRGYGGYGTAIKGLFTGLLVHVGFRGQASLELGK